MGGKFRWQTCSKESFPLRRKVVNACQQCRKKKLRCDGRKPCDRCQRTQLACHYVPLDGNKALSSTTSSPNSKRRSASPPVATTADAAAASVFDLSKLHPMDVDNDLYASLSSARIPSSSRLPPLLFDYFHVTTQPITVWTRLHHLMSQWHRTRKSSTGAVEVPVDIAQVALRLFLEHNSLYSLFVDGAQLTRQMATRTCFPSIHTMDGEYELNRRSAAGDSDHRLLLHFPVWAPRNVKKRSNTIHAQHEYLRDVQRFMADELIVDAILALTFLGAGQTLSPNTMMMDVAHAFYTSVHRRWMQMAIHASPPVQDSQTLWVMLQAGILLIHYQCAHISEEQAYMTCRLAHGCLERCRSAARNGTENHENDENHPKLISLAYILHAWHVWLSVYLNRLDPAVPLPWPLPQIRKTHDSWAWHVLTSYTPFLNTLLVVAPPNPPSVASVIEKCEHLAGQTPFEKATPSQQTMNLYRCILTIQVLSSQWTRPLAFFGNEEDEFDGCPCTLSQQACLQASEEVVHILKVMRATNQDNTTHQASSPSLLSMRYRALCMAATVLLRVSTPSTQLEALGQILEHDALTWTFARDCLRYLATSRPSIFSDTPAMAVLADTALSPITPTPTTATPNMWTDANASAMPPLTQPFSMMTPAPSSTSTSTSTQPPTTMTTNSENANDASQQQFMAMAMATATATATTEDDDDAASNHHHTPMPQPSLLRRRLKTKIDVEQLNKFSFTSSLLFQRQSWHPNGLVPQAISMQPTVNMKGKRPAMGDPIVDDDLLLPKQVIPVSTMSTTSTSSARQGIHHQQNNNDNNNNNSNDNENDHGDETASKMAAMRKRSRSDVGSSFFFLSTDGTVSMHSVPPFTPSSASASSSSSSIHPDPALFMHRDASSIVDPATMYPAAPIYQHHPGNAPQHLFPAAPMPIIYVDQPQQQNHVNHVNHHVNHAHPMPPQPPVMLQQDTVPDLFTASMMKTLHSPMDATSFAFQPKPVPAPLQQPLPTTAHQSQQQQQQQHPQDLVSAPVITNALATSMAAPQGNSTQHPPPPPPIAAMAAMSVASPDPAATVSFRNIDWNTRVNDTEWLYSFHPQ
ncbi:hypothetical protein BC940DRAFT_297621 [Gongronella butleri]|nr:hypothetical protein BC940DRAFT_297621 [Gongronella butleri]